MVLTKQEIQPKFGFSSNWDEFNRRHRRLLTDFRRDSFFTTPFADSIPFIDSDSLDNVSNWNQMQMSDGEGEFKVTVDTQDFKPEELKVSTCDNMLKIEGRHVEEGNNTCVSRQFSRSYTLPSNCKVQDMKSSFGNEGKLTVSVPKTKPAISNAGITRQVPIESSKTMESSKKIETTKKTIFDDERNAAEEVEKARNVKINRGQEFGLQDQEKLPMATSFGLGGNSSLFESWVRPIQLFNEDFSINRLFGDSMGSDDFWTMPKNSKCKVQVKEDDEKFEFVVDTDDYKPEELKVSVLDDVLKIEGKHMEEEEEAGSKRSVSKQFSRSYVLPKHVYKMDRVESCLTKAKSLVVKVPKIEVVKTTKEVNVPIKML